MNRTRGFLFTAGIVLAMAFTFSCSSDGGGGGSSEPSSSSDDASSSSSSIGYTGSYGSLLYEGKTYRTVVIGTQEWMAENLNYAVAGSKCYGEGGKVYTGDWDVENDIPITKTLSPAEVQANCDKYGRLYDWVTAMAFPPSCNSSTCWSQIQSHQGICPSGWYIPGEADWYALITAVGGDGVAGYKLKATNGWNDYVNGTDQYGFSALPGGSFSAYGGSFYDVGNFGGWWSADEDPRGDFFEGAVYTLIPELGLITQGLSGKSDLMSIRCLRSSVQSSSSSVPSSLLYEGQTYKTVVIGPQRWMAENLNYAVEGSKCGDENDQLVDNNTAYCDEYGRLYDWATAMAFPSSCNESDCSSQIQSPHQGICPSGWHIPSMRDWGKLFRYVDGTSGFFDRYQSPTAGRYLKAASGWNNNGNGTDEFGFSALPGGIGISEYGSVGGVGVLGNWWIANDRVESGSSTADIIWDFYQYMQYDEEYTNSSIQRKYDLLSVRCMQD